MGSIYINEAYLTHHKFAKTIIPPRDNFPESLVEGASTLLSQNETRMTRRNSQYDYISPYRIGTNQTSDQSVHRLFLAIKYTFI